MRLTGLAALTAVALLLTGCSSTPSFQTIADECGGVKAGILVDKDTLIVNPLDATADTLVCVTTKLLPDQKDQYKVAAASDAGVDTTLHLAGYTIDVVGTGSGSAVSFAQ